MKSFWSFVTAQWYAHHAGFRAERIDAEVRDHSDSVRLARAADPHSPRHALAILIRLGGGRQHRGWRIAFLALLIGCGFLAMADTITGSPVLAYLHTGQGVRDAPQQAIEYQDQRLDGNAAVPIVWRDLHGASLPAGQLGSFAFAQLFNIELLLTLFWLTARARILPRWTPAVAAAVWLISFVRFL
jgi:hypothetical protein